MKKICYSLLLTALAAGVSTFNSCKKPEVDTETVSTTDNALCESEFSRVFPEVNAIAIDHEGVQRLYPSNNLQSTCPVDSIDPADTLDGFPVTLYLNYGSTGCTGPDGKVRKGTIKATFFNSWDNPTDTVQIDLVNYFVNGIHYEGSVRIVKTPGSYSQTVTNGKCTKSDWTILWAGTRTLTWVAGQSTITDPSDDVFEMTGDANGTNREGKTFTVNVTSPLVRSRACAWITKGTMEITPEGKDTRIVDYGNGACDNKATLSINGNTFQFLLQ